MVEERIKGTIKSDERIVNEVNLQAYRAQRALRNLRGFNNRLQSSAYNTNTAMNAAMTSLMMLLFGQARNVCVVRHKREENSSDTLT